MWNEENMECAEQFDPELDRLLTVEEINRAYDDELLRRMGISNRD